MHTLKALKLNVKLTNTFDLFMMCVLSYFGSITFFRTLPWWKLHLSEIDFFYRGDNRYLALGFVKLLILQ